MFPAPRVGQLDVARELLVGQLGGECLQHGVNGLAASAQAGEFLGIVIGIFPREHPPAYFHAVYGEYGITVEIGGEIVHGDFPKRALRLVLEWLDLHWDELLADWELVQSGRSARKIAPLE